MKVGNKFKIQITSGSLHEAFCVQTATVGDEDRTEPHGTPCGAAWTAAKYEGETAMTRNSVHPSGAC